MIPYRKHKCEELSSLFQFKAELASTHPNNIDKSWLQLQHPKIVYIDKAKVSSSVSTLSSPNDITDVGTEELSLMLNRTDKKNKNYSKLTDTLDYKKNKIKLKKKVRAKIHINDDDESIGGNPDQSNQSKVNQSLVLSLMRPANKLKTISNSGRISYKKNSLVTKHNKKKENIPLSLSKTTQVILTDPISVENLSIILNIPPAEIIKFLFMKGISVTINQVVDIKLAKSIADEYGVIVENKENSRIILKKDESENFENQELFSKRAPIVAVFGHVDHGKTTLLDTIRSSQTAELESGGITQKIEAYQINVNQNKIIFLDTPGHEAFASTRLLGVQVTDIGVLVVAADDGLQPQSVEAITYLKDSGIPFVVALNKIDKPESNIESIKEALAGFEITPSESGGNTPIIAISALKNINIDLLLTNITNIADSSILQANPKSLASGTILNGYLDKQKGPVAHIIVQNGTLGRGDYITNSNCISKIRSITGQDIEDINSAGPSSIATISGLSSIPHSGTTFKVLENTKNTRKQLAEFQKSKSLNSNQGHQKLNTRITLETPLQNKNTKNKKVNIVLKTDSDGTIEAIIQSFSNIPQEKVQLNIVSIGVGEVNASDINLASVSNSLILSFNTNIPSKISSLALKMNVIIENFKVIYDLIEYVEKEMLKFVDIDYREQTIGCGIVESVFIVSKGNVAGSIVTEGKLKRNSYIRVHRNDELIYKGKLSSLKRVKEDVEEVSVGNECGVLCNNFDKWQKQDIISSYELIEKTKTL
uniref:Translation initiation factor IF-2, chloroplastic n=1 Tax=Palmaria palmata TaxID=2822 RepID=A0A1C9CH02_PALPL|nr:translation initiation factor 2 [Palmaria palmata]AOM67666.1 translation initiation factor 2 [Palmaria palmata]